MSPAGRVRACIENLVFLEAHAPDNIRRMVYLGRAALWIATHAYNHRLLASWLRNRIAINDASGSRLLGRASGLAKARRNQACIRCIPDYSDHVHTVRSWRTPC